jgi:pimeloyl-ACP methyl ester carboxylesterase
MFPTDNLFWTMLFTIAIPVLVILVGVAYQRIGSARDRRRYPPPGRIVSVNAVPLHVRISGQGSPTVVFESGVAASSVNWTRVQNAVAEFTSTMSYDRAGYAWSGSSPDDLTAVEMVSMLREALALTGLRPPYVLVGHSFGALLVRIYADLWPKEVAGLVLVDPALLAEWANPAPAKLRMLARGVALSRRGASLARIGFVRLSLSLLTSGARALPKLISKITSGKGGHSVLERIIGEVRKMPPELWPAIQSHWCRPESFQSMARHLEVLPATATRVFETKPNPEIPVTVISGGHLTPEERSEHQSIAQSSHRGRHIRAEHSGHWVQLDQPELVIEAIREMTVK